MKITTSCPVCGNKEVEVKEVSPMVFDVQPCRKCNPELLSKRANKDYEGFLKSVNKGKK